MNKQIREAVELFEEVMIFGTARVIRSVDNPLWKEYSPQQIQMLKIIHKYGPITSGRLADVQGVHKSAISNRLKKLSDQGLIQMVKTETDQRAKLLELTEEGARIVLQSDRVLYEYLEQLLSGQVEEQEVEQFIAMFRKLKNILRWDGE
ncbi:MarR family winged helix-turn-helix transcriptional regulator [Bacillus thermotolerans]|uniref:MarR family winged helix-turn-helix transcriptional regulator n=1 Tax=Bacillus thermotolerans TaxID=1221996 RepID=UPI00057F3B6B|nr:MarR family transcriptional regulator [Bacillus thermotolerans]KKB38298.1 Transcriptional regulator, MarR family [Bacillus thermotolerans]